MLAREMSSPRARSMSGRLLAHSVGPDNNSTDSPSQKLAPLSLGAKPQAGSMIKAVTAGQTKQQRLQAATQLRNLNRSSRSASEANLAAIHNGTARAGKRSPSPEVLQAASRLGEQLVPSTNVSEASKSKSKLERIHSEGELEPDPEEGSQPDPDPVPEPEVEDQSTVTFADDQQLDEEKGMARP